MSQNMRKYVLLIIYEYAMEHRLSDQVVSFRIEYPLPVYAFAPGIALASASFGGAFPTGGFAPTQSQPPKVRKEFPETWIWDKITEEGFVVYIILKLFGYGLYTSSNLFL